MGSDVAGVVTQAAGHGTGPRVGTRVVALANGGFAQRIAVDGDSVAAVPPTVDRPTRQRYPLPALLHYVHCGLWLGARQASAHHRACAGGVGLRGRLASSAGAQVIASVGSAARGRGLREDGAADVVIGLNGIDQPVDTILDHRRRPQMAEGLGPPGTGREPSKHRLDLGPSSGLPRLRPRSGPLKR